MQYWTNIRTFTTKRFKVTLDWTWEDDIDLSWDETGEVAKRIESGEWGVYVYRVRVLCDGSEIATDYLGNSIYADPMEFAKELKDGYFPAMVATVIGEARKALCNPPRKALCNPPRVRCAD